LDDLPTIRVTGQFREIPVRIFSAELEPKSANNDFHEAIHLVRSFMASHQSPQQKETIERVMHEFKHGELKTSRGRKVKNPKQAIAIGLHEAGASQYESKEKNRQNLKRTKARERRGTTEKDRSEHANGRESSKAQLYEEAKRRDIPGRSKMSRQQLERALH
jgi:hypothetical protein